MTIGKLSGYRIMWLQVIFDLPVGTRKERREANQFRNALLDLGFEMEQFSVYLRDCADKKLADTLMRQVEGYLPDRGSVKMLTFTDRQYENIRSYRGTELRMRRKNREQLQLF